MKITNLRGSNFKGCSFEHSLAPITVFCGANSGGKSARLEVIQLALAGYVPGVPATPNGIYQAFGGQGDCVVGARLDNVKAAGAGGKCGVIRALRPKGKSVQREDAWDSLPADWSVAPVAVDATEYLSAPEAERTRTLFKLAKLTRKITAETVTAALKNIRIENNTEPTQKFIADLCRQVEVTYEPVAAGKQTVQEWIIDLSTYFKAKKKSADDAVKRMSATVQGITELRASAPPSPGTVQDVERRLAGAKQKDSELSKVLGSLEQTLNDAARQQKVMERIQADLAGPLKDVSPQLTAKKTQLTALKEGHQTKPDVEGLTRRQAEVVKQGSVLKTEIDALDLAVIRERRELAARMAHDSCPYCKSTAPGWKSVIESEAQLRIDEFIRQRDDKNKLREPLAAEYNELKQRLSAADQLLTLWNTHERLIVDLTVEIHNLELDMARRSETIKQRDEMKEVPVADTKKRHGEVLAELQGIRDARAALDADKLRLGAERTEALQKIQAADAAQTALNEAQITKQAAAAVETLCEQLVSDSIKPLIDKVNSMCGIIMPAPLEFRDGEIGWRENGVWISKPKQLGGARRTLLFAALSVALSEPGGIVIIDELANLDPANRRAVLGHFETLIGQGVIGQAIFATPDASDLKGWNGLKEAAFINVT
jgi:hypothetical protein